MSIIFGIYNYNGAPVDCKQIDKMKQAMAQLNFNGEKIWYECNICFGHMELYNTPESKYEQWPLYSKNKLITITSHARIDNRDELFHFFSYSTSQQQKITDADLLLMAYKKWGTEFPSKVVGNWMCVIFDKRVNRLFIARDQGGETALFYYHNSKQFIFSSSLKGLLALDCVSKEIDYTELANIYRVFLTFSFGKTYYKNINYLSPGHSINLERNSQPAPKEYWSFRNVPRLKLKNEEEYFEAFLDVFTQAVKCRLRNTKKIGIALSGGFDSGSVATIAAHELRRQNRQLEAFSSVPYYEEVENDLRKTKVCNETNLIKDIANKSGNINCNFLTSENITPFEGMKRILEIVDQPVVGSANAYWLADLVDNAKESGIGTLLTGQMGNSTISYTGSHYIFDYLNPFNLYGIAKYLLAMKKSKGLKFTVKKFIKSLIPYISFSQEALADKYAALNPKFKKNSFQNRLYQQKLKFIEFKHSRMYQFYHILLSHYSCNYWYNHGAEAGIEITDPTIDRRLVEFCWSLPDIIYCKYGFEKYLIKKSMKNLLPESVLNNKNKGIQASDILPRLQHEKEVIENILLNFRKADQVRNFLDLEQLENTYQKIIYSKKTTSPIYNEIVATLMRGAMIGMFLNE